MNEHALSITSEILASSASTVCRLKIETLKFCNTFGPKHFIQGGLPEPNSEREDFPVSHEKLGCGNMLLIWNAVNLKNPNTD